MEKLTYIKRAKRILEAEKPLSSTGIWEIAKMNGYDKFLQGQGKTPWTTLVVQLYCYVGDRNDSYIC